ncbi:hypothetical protein ACL02S_14155 [Nocardia sp. 004]|uniref:hypothetical protein n=1 Tax=Nocardia sp. 004 TaxID=3385978 RepID=UPI0039A10D54
MKSNDDYGIPPMVRQGELIAEIGGLLVDEFGDDWLELRLDVRTLGPKWEEEAFIKRRSLDTVRVLPQTMMGRQQKELRKVTATPEGGAWFSMSLTVTPDHRATAKFDYDTEPAWHRGPAYKSYLSELKRFPRSEENMPPWFRQRMEEKRLESLRRAAEEEE